MENKKIPVAKDNTEMSDMVRNYRLKAGHFADQAFDGLQAIDPVKTVKPDLILLDKSLDKKRPTNGRFLLPKAVRLNKKRINGSGGGWKKKYP